ncbi:NAD(P)/FAD-dependent oxidoreductase [Sphingomonas sp. MG17]|uniref:NAD(P)/FAD-dependent oxidoreductase n=1 Tax=Sphingomonas tagetis TaxID=2949092 RepID=A0A9X2HLX6_9SPHN|nr:NAD(P)/FAD-dependent oxidoreductase [Sphingomonas tagetis]
MTDPLGLTGAITRRDFFNGTLAAGGAALLAGCGGGAQGDAAAALAPSGSPWTGYGGVGDYAWSNGNTHAVVDAAHGIRDRRYPDPAKQPVDEEVDLVVVGGGFSGMTAAYEFNKRAPAGKTCLLLDNHPMIGGEAKQNEFDVDGRRLVAPQGSNGSIVPHPGYVRGSFGNGYYDVFTDYYREFGLPTKFEREPLGGGAERYNLPDYHFDPMFPGAEKEFATGYHFAGKGWAKDPTKVAFANTHWPAAVQKELDDYVQNRRDVLGKTPDAERWLDTITYADLLDKLRYGKEVRDYIDPYIAVGNFGVGSNAISAYAGHKLGLSGTTLPPKPGEKPKPPADISVVSFPGGNTVFLRTMLQRIIPGAIGGKGDLAGIATGPIDFKKLDRPGGRVRIRLSATAMDMRHDGDPASAESVIVSYVRDGKLRRVRAKAVVMASGGWVNRNIVTDMSDGHRAAYAQYHHAPVMIANVALRHWRFFDKLGFANARAFGALGWQVGIRRNVAFGGEKPFTPDDPTVLTFYIPFLRPDLPATAQGPAARQQLFATTYAEFEKQIRQQLADMFGATGFDARDIAGIILNRWGHAYCSPQPGFYFGKDDQPPPSDVIRKPHGRITFAHSELNGSMQMAHGMHEAYRAAGQVMAMI